ncbi:hypothetical protein [Planobispora rosea]|uniref:hypothetical protein n=1 Tax=Planobispora rosea TaxID=35762 RepID=UPI00083A3ED5|nr:hypothetical protein [Planobispora rosea]
MGDYTTAWAELRGYVGEAVNGGGQIDPQQLADYMDELKRRVLAPRLAWIVEQARTAPVERVEDLAGRDVTDEDAAALRPECTALCRDVEQDRDEIFDLLAAIWLYIDWRYVTRQLNTEQKDLFANAIEASSRRAGLDTTVDRWWRPAPSTGDSDD